jgi:hypothetical protein
MFYPEKKYRAQVLFVIIAAVSVALFISCSRGDDQAEAAQFSEDEKYLIDAYVNVKRATADYLNQREAAENALARLDSTIDATRIANTIQSLNENPERWADVFREIENILREAPDKKELEETGGRS